MSIKSVIAFVATSALALKLVQHLSQKQQRRRMPDESHHTEVNRWENEGGNLPPKPQR